MEPLQVDDEGVMQLSHLEGRVLHRYLDSAGVETVCVGHVVRPADAAILADGISEADCNLLLHRDLSSVEREIVRVVPPEIRARLSQRQVNALASFEFNTGGLAHSTLLRELNLGHFAAAADHFAEWNKRRDPKTGILVVDAVLVKRRAFEAQLFRQDIHPDLAVPDGALVWLLEQARSQEFDLTDGLGFASPPSRDTMPAPAPIEEPPTLRDPALPPKREDEA